MTSIKYFYSSIFAFLEQGKRRAETPLEVLKITL